MAFVCRYVHSGIFGIAAVVLLLWPITTFLDSCISLSASTLDTSLPLLPFLGSLILLLAAITCLRRSLTLRSCWCAAVCLSLFYCYCYCYAPQALTQQDMEYFGGLMSEVERFELVTDELYSLDVQFISDDDKYFPFEVRCILDRSIPRISSRCLP